MDATAPAAEEADLSPLAGRTEIRPFHGRIDRADAGCPGEDAAEVEAEIDAINDRLAQCGIERRIPSPRGCETDRDRISTQLLLALKDLRQSERSRSSPPSGPRSAARASDRPSTYNDQRIVDLLYRLSMPVLLTFCRARIRRSEFALDARDLIEDVFLSIWLKCDLFQERTTSTYTGWALVIAENHILQLTRRLRRERDRVRTVAETSPRIRATLDPARDAATHEVLGRFRSEYMLLTLLCADALGQLPERALELLNLRDRDGLSYDAIAERLEVSRSHVGMWIRRARKRVFDTVARALRLAPLSQEGRPS